MVKARKSGYDAWLRLLRIPNFFTVPGDVLAGFVLADGTRGEAGSLGWTMGIALCLYAVGIVLNDLVDLEVDRRERPERPLPSGAISVRQARSAVLVGLLAAGGMVALVVPSVWMPAACLAAIILAYDFRLKRIPILGELALGSCRAASVLLGTWIVTSGPVPLSAVVGCAVIFAYVFGLSLLARHEVAQDAAPVVGRLVRGLILVQAALVASAGHYLLSLLVAVLWIPATGLGRRYSSS